MNTQNFGSIIASPRHVCQIPPYSIKKPDTQLTTVQLIFQSSASCPSVFLSECPMESHNLFSFVNIKKNNEIQHYVFESKDTRL